MNWLHNHLLISRWPPDVTMTRYLTRTCTCDTFNVILGWTQWWYLMAMRVVIRRKSSNNRDEHRKAYPEIFYLMSVSKPLPRRYPCYPMQQINHNLLQWSSQNFSIMECPWGVWKSWKLHKGRYSCWRGILPQVLWCSNSSNTVTHATTVTSVDLHYHIHFNWSFCHQQEQQQDSTPCKCILLCSNGTGISWIP